MWICLRSSESWGIFSGGPGGIPGVIIYYLGLPPTQDASHHQDYYIFSRESQPKPSFATVTGWGVDPIYYPVGGNQIIQISGFCWGISLILMHFEEFMRYFPCCFNTPLPQPLPYLANGQPALNFLGITYLVGKISRSNFYFRVHWLSKLPTGYIWLFFWDSFHSWRTGDCPVVNGWLI